MKLKFKSVFGHLKSEAMNVGRFICAVTGFMLTFACVGSCISAAKEKPARNSTGQVFVQQQQKYLKDVKNAKVLCTGTTVPLAMTFGFYALGGGILIEESKKNKNPHAMPWRRVPIN